MWHPFVSNFLLAHLPIMKIGELWPSYKKKIIECFCFKQTCRCCILRAIDRSSCMAKSFLSIVDRTGRVFIVLHNIQRNWWRKILWQKSTAGLFIWCLQYCLFPEKQWYDPCFGYRQPSVETIGDWWERVEPIRIYSFQFWQKNFLYYKSRHSRTSYLVPIRIRYNSEIFNSVFNAGKGPITSQRYLEQRPHRSADE